MVDADQAWPAGSDLWLESVEPHMDTLKIKTDRCYGEADLLFYPRTDNQELLDELHDIVVKAIDGVRTKYGIPDAVVAIRKRDFDDVVKRLADYYRSRGYRVTVE